MQANIPWALKKGDNELSAAGRAQRGFACTGAMLSRPAFQALRPAGSRRESMKSPTGRHAFAASVIYHVCMSGPACDGCRERDSRIAELEARIVELGRFQRETAFLRDEAKSDRDLRLLTGESQAMKTVRQAIQQVARTDSTVLIVGETGTGKELIARAIHQLSPRRERLLVAVNCAALAPTLVASELFGHEPGAFTGATRRRIGRFELAHQGTIFLDEVGELPSDTQVMLLRVLQDRVIERVGGNEPVAVDVRVIAATHRDLTAAMSQAQFRPDLFFRLNVFPIHVPPLRDRREDIADLVRHFLLHFSRRMNKAVTQATPATLNLLTGYHWPGNVRELENIIERAMIVTTGDALLVEPRWLQPVPRDGGIGET
jgi:formate hydrogenlyase transcriptional activator